MWDRKIFVIGSKLRLVTTADEFGGKLDWVEQVIHETNEGVEKHNLAVQKQQEVRIEQELRKQKLWEKKATVQSMRDALRKRYA